MDDEKALKVLFIGEVKMFICLCITNLIYKKFMTFTWGACYCVKIYDGCSAALLLCCSAPLLLCCSAAVQQAQRPPLKKTPCSRRVGRSRCVVWCDNEKNDHNLQKELKI